MAIFRVLAPRFLLLLVILTTLVPALLPHTVYGREDGNYVDGNGNQCTQKTVKDDTGANIYETCTNPTTGAVQTCDSRTGTGAHPKQCTDGRTGGAATPPSAAPATPAPATTATNIENKFVPLTNLPGIEDAGNSESLPKFLNSLYRLCIGAAAVIAILQIMRAGVYFMFNKGSVAQNEQGKSLIQNSIIGLVLVLSPAIVFGIINPDILNLKLDVSKLRIEETGPVDIMSNATIPAESQAMCAAQEKTQVVPWQGQMETGNECTAIGSGWISTNFACCKVADDSKKVCCGYRKDADESLKPKPPPAPEDNQTGGYLIEYVVEDRDYESHILDNGTRSCVRSDSARFNTLQECQTRLKETKVKRSCGTTTCSTAARHNCVVAKTETYAPNKGEYDRVNALPGCP